MSLLAGDAAEKRTEDHAGEVVNTAAGFCGIELVVVDMNIEL